MGKAKEYIAKLTDFTGILEFLLGGIIFLLFNYVYVSFIVEHYDYMGFSTNGVSFVEVLVAIAVFTITNVHYVTKQSRFIRAICTLVQLFFLFPNVVLWLHMDLPFMVITCIVIFILLLSWNGLNLPKIRTTILSVNEQGLVLVLLGGLFFVPFAVGYNFHFSSNLFKLGEIIYEIREENQQSGNSFLAYLLSPYVKVLIPLMIAYSVIYKRYVLTALGFVLMLLMFTLTAHKSIFFSAIVVLGFASLRKINVQLPLMMVGLSSIIILGILASWNGELLINSIVVRRVFFVPAYLNFAYMELFADEQFYYGYSFMKWFVEYPYDLEPAKLVGEAYFGSASVNANNGFICDALVNLGFVGAIPILILVTLVFKLIDSLQINEAYFGLFFLFIFTLLSSGLFTTLLSHGGFFLITVSVFLISNTGVKHSK
jgi:hypothetical protein